MEETSKKAVRLVLRESDSFRVINGGGAFGGISPLGLIYAAIYNDLPMIPSEVTQEVGSDGVLGKETKRIINVGVDRRLEVGILMNAMVAKSFADWLLSQVEKLEAINKGEVSKVE